MRYLLIFLLLIPSALCGGSVKGYEIGRIYRDGKQTVVDVTYWEYDVKTETIPYSVMVKKSVIKKFIADYPTVADKISKSIKDKAADGQIKDTDEIKVEGVSTYTHNVKKGIIGKEKITYQEDVKEADIYKLLNDRLLLLLPTVEITAERKLKEVAK